MMYRVIETDPRRPEMHPSDDRRRFQFGGCRKYDGTGDFMVGEEADAVHPIARFVTGLIGRRACTRAHQRMD